MKTLPVLGLALIGLACPLAAYAQDCDTVKPSFEVDTDRFKSAELGVEHSNPSLQSPLRELADFEADIFYPESPLSYIEFEFDGERKRFSPRSEQLTEKGGGRWELAIKIGPRRSGADVQIQHGRVLVTVETVGTDGCKSTNRISLVGGDSRVRAVIVGVSDYSYVQPLEHAANDAREFKALLESYFEDRKPDLKVDLFVDDNAMERNIIKRMQDIHDTVSAYGSFIFYFSGHGTIARDPFGRLTPYLAVKDSEADNASTMLDKQSIVSYLMAESKAKLKLYVVDSCLSGVPLPSSGIASLEGGKPKRLALAQRVQQALRDPARSGKIFVPPGGVIGFVSSGGSDLSYELDGLGGVYTHYLDLSVNEIDPGKTGSFNYERLHELTKEKISNSMVDQNPQFHAQPTGIGAYSWLNNKPAAVISN